MISFINDIFSQFHNKWALVTAGDIDKHNSMTISWGSMGTLWSKPVVSVYVKPCRNTHSFLSNNDYFTVSFYPEEYRNALSLMGSLSGRHCDKDKQANLTPIELEKGITYKEAEITIVCKKIYTQDLDINAIPVDQIDRHYKVEAPHTMFIGEVIEIVKQKDA